MVLTCAIQKSSLNTFSVVGATRSVSVLQLKEGFITLTAVFAASLLLLPMLWLRKRNCRLRFGFC